jgi:hypothetical protein
MKKIFFLLLLFIGIRANAQTPDPYITPNASTYNPTDTAHCAYGINSGYIGANWSDSASAHIQRLLGAHQTRTANYDFDQILYGLTWAKSTYEFNRVYNHFYNNTVFLNGMGSGRTDTNTYNIPAVAAGVSLYQSQMPKGIYNPIWNSNGTPDTANNLWVDYVYHFVKSYGQYFRYYEILNEPDIGGGPGLTALKGTAGSYWNNPPEPQYQYNTHAPVFFYIRLLRIAYEVIHRYYPNAKVVTGGVGFPVSMDMYCRYTDNPGTSMDGNIANGAGTATAAYPYPGSYFIDMASLHFYPTYSTQTYNNATSRSDYRRNSDTLCIEFYNNVYGHNGFDSVLKAYGFNGVTHPKKQFMFTETDAQKTTSLTYPNNYGSLMYQNNYTMKIFILAQKWGITQLNDYSFMDEYDLPNSSANLDDVNSYMGKYYNGRNVTGSNYAALKKAPAGIGRTTMSGLLFGYDYDSVKTAALNLNTNKIQGGAFTKAGVGTRYVLWAVQHRDKIETDTASYTFPSGITVTKAYNWNASQPSTTDFLNNINLYTYFTLNRKTILLNGSPVFIQ